MIPTRRPPCWPPRWDGFRAAGSVKLRHVTVRSSAARAPSPSSPSTTIASRSTTCGCAAQRLVATDAVLIYLFHPQSITVANARLRGLWKAMPLFVNDLAALSRD
jgi:hypothetical protein